MNIDFALKLYMTESDRLPGAVASPLPPPVPYYFNRLWAVHVLWICGYVCVWCA